MAAAADPVVITHVCDLYQAGHSTKEITQLTGVSGFSVLKWARQRGIEIRLPGDPCSPELVNRACDLYQSGHSLRKVSRLTGAGVTSVRRWLHARGIKINPRWPRGADSYPWKGDQAGYFAAHNRVRAQRGKPQKCSRCGASDPELRYEWANLTGDYLDINDYERMCVPCHSAFDAARRSA